MKTYEFNINRYYSRRDKKYFYEVSVLEIIGNWENVIEIINIDYIKYKKIAKQKLEEIKKTF